MKQYRVICPLFNFQIQWGMLIGNHDMTREETLSFFKDRQKQVTEGIELVEGVKIRLFTKQDIEALNSSLFLLPTGLHEQISSKTFLLEKAITVEEEQKSETAKFMRNIVLALRLLKEGHVYGDEVFYFQAEKRHLVSWSREGPLPTSDRMGYGYALNFEEIPDLKKLVNKIQKVDFIKRKSLDLACKRFQRAYQEYDFADRLIDYMIAFEALFLKGERRASSRGKIIAIACSTLLGINEEEREEIKKTLSIAYDIRNSIVHGGEYRKNVNPFEVVEEIECYLRDSIIKFLD